MSLNYYHVLSALPNASTGIHHWTSGKLLMQFRTLTSNRVMTPFWCVNHVMISNARDLAEDEGFEPTEQVSPPYSLANCCNNHSANLPSCFELLYPHIAIPPQVLIYINFAKETSPFGWLGFWITNLLRKIKDSNLCARQDKLLSKQPHSTTLPIFHLPLTFCISYS